MIKITFIFVGFCLSTVFTDYIGIPSTENVFTVKDDNLLEAAIFKALKPFGATEVDIDYYRRKPGAYTVGIISDHKIVTDTKSHLDKALKELGFFDAKIEESPMIGSNIREESIFEKFVLFLNEETFEKTMESFVDEIVDSTDVKVIHSRWD